MEILVPGYVDQASWQQQWPSQKGSGSLCSSDSSLDLDYKMLKHFKEMGLLFSSKDCNNFEIVLPHVCHVTKLYFY